MAYVPTTVMNLFLSLQSPGQRLVDAGEIEQAFQMLFGVSGVEPALTAPGPAPDGGFIYTTGDGPSFMSLPPAIQGMQLTVVNNNADGSDLTMTASTANAANGGQPDGIGYGLDPNATVSAGTMSVFLCTELGQWITYGYSQTSIPAPP
jgi:hypothetical protein